MIVALVAIVIVAALAAGAGAIAMRQKRLFAAANEIVPGRATTAPAAWAERIRQKQNCIAGIGEAVAALRANPTLSDGAFMESRAAIEQTAIAIDERLIAAAALPAAHRVAAIAAVEPEVDRLEASIASLAAPSAGSATQSALDDSIRAAQIRLDALADARAEIEAVDPLTALHRETIEQIEAAHSQPAQTQPAQTQTAQTQPPTEQPGGSTRSV